MAVFTKALSNKWTPNASRSPNDSKEVVNRSNSFVNRSGDELWETGNSREYRVTVLGRIAQPFPLICSSSDNPIDVQLVDVVEEAQLKGSCSSRAGRLGPNPGSPQLYRPRPAKLLLSIHGIKIADMPTNESRHYSSVQHRQPLHSILSAVSYHGQKETFIALAVHPDSIAPPSGSYVGGAQESASFGGASLAGGAQGCAPGGAFVGSTIPTFSSCSSDVVLASCLLFQANTAADAASFVKDLKDVFVAAMRVKGPSNVT